MGMFLRLSECPRDEKDTVFEVMEGDLFGNSHLEIVV